jgi:uncharacterized coiled-coil protein SlyX
LIDANKKKLSELQARVRKSNVKVTELEKMIASLNTQLAQRVSMPVCAEKMCRLNRLATQTPRWTDLS